MPNLFIATGIFHPESGGPATYLHHLLPHLQTRGYDVRLLTYGDDPPDETYPYPVTRIKREFLPWRLWRYRRAAGPLSQWADAVYVHSMALPLPRLPDTPRVMKVVGDQAWERSIRNGWIPPTTDIDAFQTQTIAHPLVKAAKALRRRNALSMDAVIVPSHYLRRMVEGWGLPPERVQVVYNALPPAHTAAPVTQSAARQQLGLDADRPLLLTAARLVYWKGIDVFIDALDAVPEVQLLVAGDGTLRGALEQRAADKGVAERVRFLGRVPREQMPLYMAAADYVGLYSGYEGLSHVILESLRAGTPVIASDKGGNPEAVRHDVNGLLVPYRDADALRAALKTAFSPGKRDALAAQTDIDAEKFAYQTMVSETAAALARFTPPR